MVANTNTLYQTNGANPYGPAFMDGTAGMGGTGPYAQTFTDGLSGTPAGASAGQMGPPAYTPNSWNPTGASWTSGWDGTGTPSSQQIYDSVMQARNAMFTGGISASDPINSYLMAGAGTNRVNGLPTFDGGKALMANGMNYDGSPWNPTSSLPASQATGGSGHGAHWDNQHPGMQGGQGGMPPPGMGMPPPQGMGGPQLNQYQPSPYLAQQMGGLQQQFNQNLQQNILPGIQSNAINAGGYGGSKQGIAEGLAISGSNTGLANAQANLLGSDYEQEMGRQLQQYQGDQQYGLGLGNLALGNKNSDQNYTLGQGNLALGYTNAANQLALGQGQLGLGYTNAANQLTLGQGQLGLGYLNANNNYALGQGQNQNQANQNANNYALGQGQIGLGYFNGANQYALGQGANQNQANSIANQFTLGTNANQNAYNLGLGQLGLGNQNSMMNFYTQQRGQDLQSQLYGSQLYGAGANGDWNALNQANGLYQPYTGYGTNSTYNGGNNWAAGAGNGLGAYQYLTGGGYTNPANVRLDPMGNIIS